MARLRYNNALGTLGAALTASGTTITFAAAPPFPTITGTDYIPLVLEPPTASPSANFEVVYLTAYTAGATTGTISRGQEGTTAVAHAAGVEWACAPVAADFVSVLGDIVDYPATSDARYAQRSNNLSDVQSAATARINLGLGAAATQGFNTADGAAKLGDDGTVGGANGSPLAVSILQTNSEWANSPRAGLLASSYSSGTTLSVDRTLSVQQQSYIGVDVGTSSCELATVSSSSGSTITLTAALSLAHSAGARVETVVGGEVPAWWFGVLGNGTNDDTVAAQQAFRQCASRGLWVNGGGRTSAISAMLLAPTGCRIRQWNFTARSSFSPASSNNAMLMGQNGNIVPFTCSGGWIVTASAHGNSLGVGVVLTGIMPGTSGGRPAVAHQHYYATQINGGGANTFKLASTPTLATAGTSDIDTSDPSATGSGTMYGSVCQQSRQYFDDVFINTASVPGVNGFATNWQQPAYANKLRIDNATSTNWGTLSAPLSTAAPITSLPVNALAAAIPAGHISVCVLNQLWAIDTVAAPNGVAAGATAIPVLSQTPAFAYPAGTTVNSGAFCLWLSGQQGVFWNFESIAGDTGVVLDNASFMDFLGRFDVEQCSYRVMHVRRAGQLMSTANGGAFNCTFSPCHHELNPTPTVFAAYDLEGQTAALLIESPELGWSPGLGGSVTGTTSSGSNQVTSITGTQTNVQNGDALAGPGISAGTTLVSGAGTSTWTMSQNAGAGAGAGTVTASWPWPFPPAFVWCHSGAVSSSGFEIRNPRTSSSPVIDGLKYVNDTDRSISRDLWTDFTQRAPRLWSAPTAASGTPSPALPAAVWAFRNGRYVYIGNNSPGQPNVDSQPSSDQTGDQAVFRDISGNAAAGFSKDGHPKIATTAVPADADIATGTVELYWDQTAGVAVPRFKGKDSGGAVVTGAMSGGGSSVGAWTSLTLGTGITAGLGPTPAACVDSLGIVRLRGSLKNTSGGSIVANTVVATLPGGMAPTDQLYLTGGQLTSGAAVQSLKVMTDGTIQTYVAFASNNQMGLDGLQFLTSA